MTIICYQVSLPPGETKNVPEIIPDMVLEILMQEKTVWLDSSIRIKLLSQLDVTLSFTNVICLSQM